MPHTTQYSQLLTYLRADQVEAMRERAFTERRPMAELYRDAIDRYLTQPATEQVPVDTTGEQPE